MMSLEETNDPAATSWVEVPAGADFPIQNLPFGIFQRRDTRPATGVALGDFVIDVAWLHDNGYLVRPDLPAGIFRQPYLNDFLALGRPVITAVRNRISALMRAGSDEIPDAQREQVLVDRRGVTMLLPVRVPNYTDFYSSEEHAINVGSIFRDPKNPLLPNWKHLPVAYHGRASSIVVSGTGIHRPRGQVRSASESRPEFVASRKLDFELELAFVTCGETRPGHRIAVENAEDYIAGLVLFNDWSARDIQQWEYVPLGPFAGKNFASTISPWLVTLDALEPFRVSGPPQEPEVLPYLRTTGKRNFDIVLEVTLQPQGSGETVVCRTNARYLYWNASQQLAHHTANGCNIQVGDICASGTISGPSPGSFGSLLELSWNGEKPLTMPDGSERTFLEDGDTVIMRGFAGGGSARIGFGSCRGTILPPL